MRNTTPAAIGRAAIRRRGDRAGRRRRPVFLSFLLALLLALGAVLSLPARALADGPTTFTNSTAMTIPGTTTSGVGKASVYPSTISVHDMTGSVTKVTATLTGLTHNSAGDLDVLLVSPSGENLVLLSDLGTPKTGGAANQLVIASNDNMTFDDEGSGPPDSAANLPSSGTYKPYKNPLPGDAPDYDTFPSPAPTASSLTTLAAAFTGIEPNGDWKLFINDSRDGDGGSLAGWSLTITTATNAASTATTLSSSDTSTTTGDSVTFTATVTSSGSPVTTGSVQFTSDGSNIGSAVALNGSGQAAKATSALTEGDHEIRAIYQGTSDFLTSTSAALNQRVDNATVVTGNTFCNTGAVIPPGTGPATPYPSKIFVSGLGGNVTKVAAQLKGVSHTAPIDFDVLLAGPTSTKNLLLMSDVGGTPSHSISNLNLTFDDTAGGPIGAGQITGGTYKPTNSDDTGGNPAADTFPGAAPAVSSATTLATFNGAAANGTWTLWVVDDASGDSGQIANGWCLTITAPAATTTALTADPTSSTLGQSVVLTAAVQSGGNPVNVGSVTFRDGGTEIGSSSVVNGVATLTVPLTSVGSHSLTADFSGNDSYATSSDSLSYTVDPHATTTDLASSKNPASVGESVTFTATVTSGGSPVTTGSVQFSDDGSPLLSVPVDGQGVATYTTSGLAAGDHPIKAAYLGVTDYAGSDDTLTQGIDKLLTQTSLDIAPSTVLVDDQVTFTATVTSGGAPVAVGDVEFKVDGNSAGTETVDAQGVATLTTSSLAAGPHTITASYAGTGTYTASDDSGSLTVGKHATEIALATDPNPAEVGQSVTFTATVTQTVGGAPVPVGDVEFKVDGSPAGADTVDAQGVATFSTTTLAAGTHEIVASYAVGAKFLGSTSEPASLVVGKIPTTTVITSTPNPSNNGQQVTVTATVTRTSGGAAVTSGQVTIAVDGVDRPAESVDGAGEVSFSTDTLDPGQHTLAASYAANSTYAASSSSGDDRHSVRPVAAANGPYEIAEGEDLTLDSAGSSTTDATYEWDVNGDNNFSDATGANPTLTWDQLQDLGVNDGPATRQVKLRVSVESVQATDEADLGITNVAPGLVLTGGRVATVAQPFTIKVGADDESAADMAAQFTYTVDWGDGSPIDTVVGPADPPVTHTYALAGDYAAKFTATDKDGATSAGGGPDGVQSVNIEAQNPVLTDPGDDDDGSDNGDSDNGDSDNGNSSSGNGGSKLAATGSPVGLGEIGLGVGLMLAGGSALVAARRRRS